MQNLSIFLITIFLAIYLQITNSQKVTTNNELENLKRQYLPEQFSNSNFTLEDAKNLLYKKCKKAALNSEKVQTYENIEMAANKLIQCANDIANITILMGEIEAARPFGEMDVVFKKYCSKLPQAEQCLQDFNEQLLPCLTPAERAQNAIMMHIITSLLGFICHRNGDQIALFILEEGPECLEANKENISNCMNATFSAYMPVEGQVPPSELPELVMGPEQCIDLHDFEECVLSYMEKCNEITPANIIESLFRHVKNETKCEEKIEQVNHLHPVSGEARNGAVGYTFSKMYSLAIIFFGLNFIFKCRF